MESETVPCPGCGSPLVKSSGAGAVGYSCPACGGGLCGLSPFERQLTDGTGARLWVASREGVPAVPCPYCPNPMRQPGPGAGGPDGLAMCHLCEQVWIPAGAAPWMASHAAPAPARAAAPTPVATECSNCGAPLEPDQMGRCRYCHAQVAAPQPIILEMAEDPWPRPAQDFLGGRRKSRAG